MASTTTANHTQLDVRYTTATSPSATTTTSPGGTSARLFPELRNRVYRELLVIKDGATHCWPHILSTSRAMNAEAYTILYGENIQRIALSFTEHSQMHLAARIQTGKHRTFIPIGEGGFKNFPLGLHRWPRGLHHFQNIDVHLSFLPRRRPYSLYDSDTHDQAKTAIYLLCFIVASLRTASRDIKVTINIPITKNIRTLLKQLPPRVKVKRSADTTERTPKWQTWDLSLNPTALLPRLTRYVIAREAVELFKCALVWTSKAPRPLTRA